MEHEATGCTRILVRVLPEAGCAKAYAAKSHTEVSHRLSQIFKRPAHILQHTIANTRGYSKDIKILEVPMGGRAEGGAMRKPLRDTTVKGGQRVKVALGRAVTATPVDQDEALEARLSRVESDPRMLEARLSRVESVGHDLEARLAHVETQLAAELDRGDQLEQRLTDAFAQ
jgi:hypothetical protein